MSATSTSGKMATRIRAHHLWICPCRYDRRSNDTRRARVIDRRQAKAEIREQVAS